MEKQGLASGACSLPTALDDLTLIAAIDNEADAVVQAHLDSCQSCAARAQEFAAIQVLLRWRLFRMFCPSSDDLAAFQQRLLEGPRYTLIAHHLSECLHCRHELQLLQELMAAPLTIPRRADSGPRQTGEVSEPGSRPDLKPPLCH